MNANKHRFTFYVTPYQAEILGKFATRQLGKAVKRNDTVPETPKDLPAKYKDETATKCVGGHLDLAIYLKLKTMAEKANLSMSKTAIRLLQLPE